MVGIVKENMEMGKQISFHILNEAYNSLYGEYISDETAKKLDFIFNCDDLEELFYNTVREEKANLDAALNAESIYGNDINENNIDSFIKHFREQ